MIMWKTVNDIYKSQISGCSYSWNPNPNFLSWPAVGARLASLRYYPSHPPNTPPFLIWLEHIQLSTLKGLFKYITGTLTDETLLAVIVV